MFSKKIYYRTKISISQEIYYIFIANIDETAIFCLLYAYSSFLDNFGGIKMNKLLRKIVFSCIFAFVLAFLPVFAFAIDGNVRLVVDGQELRDLSAPPIIVNDRTLVPFRDVFEHVGGVVGWHNENRQVSLFFGDDVLVMTIDDINANLNGEIIEMHTAPIIHNDRTMVPLRFPIEVFGFDVNWDESTRSVIVHSNGNGRVPYGTSGTPIISLPPVESEGETEVVPLPYEYEETDDESDKEDIPWEGGDGEPLPGTTVAQGGMARNVSTSVIQTIAHQQTTITSLQTPRETGMAAYVAVASSAISEVQSFLLPDNRLVVDIHNAVSLISGEFYVPANIPVTGARASQFSQTPRVTRIVFEVVGEAEYSISLSADRTRLTVSFSQNQIMGISTQSDAFSDSIFIQGEILPSISISTEGFPNFLTINIDNAVIDAASGTFDGGIFASNFTAGQRDDGSAYVRVYIHGEWPSFSTAGSANSVAFMMHHGVSGVRYDSVNRELRISREFAMDISQVQRVNDYLRFSYTFVLPPSAEVLGRGEISVLDGFVNSVALSRDAYGYMNLTFTTARVLTFSIHEDENYYIIRAHLPRDVSPFIVVIDPGHGGTDPGSIQHGVVEKDLVLAISHKVANLLESDPFITVYMTRREDTFVSLLNRAEFANELGADLFVSIHANAAEISRGVINPAVHGIETWYTVGELERAGNHSMDSRRLAEILQRHLLAASGAHDRGLRNAPNFVVLRETRMPSALLELGFLTNPAEALRLSTSAYQWQLAHAIHQGIVEASLANPPTW